MRPSPFAYRFDSRPSPDDDRQPRGLAVGAPIMGRAGARRPQVAGTAGSGGPPARAARTRPATAAQPDRQRRQQPDGQWRRAELMKLETDLPPRAPVRAIAPGRGPGGGLTATRDGRPHPRSVPQSGPCALAEAPVSTVFSDQPNLGFTVDAAALLVKDVDGQALMNNAETIAHWAVTTRMSTIATCTTTDATCRKQFITSFGKRAFRAPLSDARVAAYEKLFMAESSFADGAEAVVGRDAAVPLLPLSQRARPHVGQPGQLGDVDAATRWPPACLPADRQHARRHPAGGRGHGGEQRCALPIDAAAHPPAR